MPKAGVIFVRYPDLPSGPRFVEATRALYPSIIKDARWKLNGVDQGPVAGVRHGLRHADLADGHACSASTGSRSPSTVFAADLDTAQTAFTRIRLTPERATS